MPAVSVIMPVFNGERFLHESIESVLGQTFRDFEFLIIDDGSTDRSAAIIASYSDPRIRILSNEVNQGLVFTLNRGLDEAAGEYFARFDADDVALPQRLERQLRFLEQTPSVGMVGTWFMAFGEDEGVASPCTDHDQIVSGLLFNNQFGHPTVMFRASLLRDTGARYANDYFPIEDWELWTRLATRTQLANIPEVLLRYRRHSASVTGALGAHLGSRSRTRQVSRALYSRMLQCLGMHPTESDLDVHSEIALGSRFDDRGARRQAENWLRRLIAANRASQKYPEPAFSKAIGSRWTAIQFHRNARLGSKLLEWSLSPLMRHSFPSVCELTRSELRRCFK